jgi:hypothetical protein
MQPNPDFNFAEPSEPQPRHEYRPPRRAGNRIAGMGVVILLLAVIAGLLVMREVRAREEEKRPKYFRIWFY